MNCQRCRELCRALGVTVCVCVAAESLPVSHDRISVPDTKLVADVSPHTHPDRPRIVQMPAWEVTITAGTTIGTVPSFTWSAPPLDDFDPSIT